MNIHIYIVTAIGLLEAVFGTWLLVRYQRSRVNQLFAIFVLLVAVWVISNALYLFDFSDATLIFIGRLSWFIGVPLSVAFLLFSREFPYPSDNSRFPSAVLTWLPIAFFFPLIFLTNYVITDHFTNIENFKTGELYFLYILFFVGYWGLALISLFAKFRQADGIHQKQLAVFLMGVIISLVFVLTTDIVLPSFDISYPTYIGSETSVIWLGFCYYIIKKQ